MRWIAAVLVPLLLAGQDRLETMPGYEQYARMRREIPSAVKSGALSVTWTSNTAFEYARDGKRYRFDVASGRSSEVSGVPSRNRKESQQPEPERGRQFDSALSPDGKLK